MPQPQAAILGCTHYPLMEEIFRDALGKNVAVYSQANLVAESLLDYLDRHPNLSSNNKPKNIFITTGDPVIVSMRATQFLKRSVEFISA
jgi:glutamate racemase